MRNRDGQPNRPAAATAHAPDAHPAADYGTDRERNSN